MVIREEKRVGRWCVFSDGEVMNTRVEYDKKPIDGITGIKLEISVDDYGVLKPTTLHIEARRPKIELDVPRENIHFYIPDLEEIKDLISGLIVGYDDKKDDVVRGVVSLLEHYYETK